MSKFILTYFNLRARAEVTRMLFSIGGIPYSDIRIDREQHWPKMKPTMPFGNLPVLEVDGKVLCQSHVIERFVARKVGMLGDTDWAQTQIEMVIACLEDTWGPAFKILKETDKATKETLLETYRNEQLPFYLDRFNTMLPKGASFFVDNKISWADLVFAVYMDLPKDFAGVTIKWTDQPRLKGVIDGVHKHPAIEEWIAKRPQTPL